MFNFNNLITKYTKGKVIYYKKAEGYYDYDNGGVWVGGDTETIPIAPAAIVPMSNEDTKYTEGGHITVGDMKLYCYKRLGVGDEITHLFEDGAEKTYKVLSHKDYSDFDLVGSRCNPLDRKGLHIYTLKRVANVTKY